MRQTVRGLARRDAILVYLGMDALAEGREALEGHDVDRLIEMDGDPVEVTARDSRQCENLAGERLVQVPPANMRTDEDRRRRLVIGLGSKGGERVPVADAMKGAYRGKDVDVFILARRFTIITLFAAIFAISFSAVVVRNGGGGGAQQSHFGANYTCVAGSGGYCTVIR